MMDLCWKLRYCLGSVAPIRCPLPAAGMTAQTAALLAIGCGALGGDQLDKGFAFLDHTEIVTRLFFEGVESVLQIEHLGFENFVSGRCQLGAREGFCRG